MPYEIPTLPAIIKRAEADFERNAPDALRRSDAKVSARVVAGAAFELYGYQDYIARQSHPSTCDEEMLLKWAAIKLEDGRKPAVSASGMGRVTGSTGALVDVGVMYQSSDGRRYIVKTTATLVNGAAQVTLSAELTGTVGNIESGTLTAVSPVLGVNPTLIIGDGGIVGGTDEEGIEPLRARVEQEFKNPSKVGSGADFIGWAKEVPGVTRAWALPRWMGPGTFGLTFVRDGDPGIFPNAEQVAEVQAYLDIKRPVTAEVFVFAPIELPVNFTIKLSPDSTALRAAVTTSLKNLISDEGGSDSTILITHIRAAISNTPNENDHVLASPAANVVVAKNEIATLGAITWQ
jgi:uncharacterized phage protein gp47/JayE